MDRLTINAMEPIMKAVQDTLLEYFDTFDRREVRSKRTAPVVACTCPYLVNPGIVRALGAGLPCAHRAERGRLRA